MTQATAITVPAPEPEDEFTDEPLQLVAPPKVTIIHSETCPKCSRNPMAAKKIAASEDLTEVQTFIENVDTDTSYVLDRIEEHVTMQRATLAKPVTPVVAPRPRIRKAAAA
jgi:hypothetical protein